MREDEEMLTKGKRDRHLKDCQGPRSSCETHPIRIQRNRRELRYWNFPLSTWTHAIDGVKVLTWTRGRPNDHVNCNTQLHGKNTVQDSCNPLVLSCDGVGSGMVRTSEQDPFEEKKLDL